MKTYFTLRNLLSISISQYWGECVLCCGVKF